jgi:hypothetical protein
MDDFHQLVGSLSQQIERRVINFFGLDIPKGEEKVLHLLIEKMPAVFRIDFEQVVDSLDRFRHFFCCDKGQFGVPGDFLRIVTIRPLAVQSEGFTNCISSRD